MSTPTTKEPPWALIEKVIGLERRKGFRDAAVIGGLEAFLELHWPEGAALVRGYAGMSPDERERALSALEAALDQRKRERFRSLAVPIEEAAGVGPTVAKLLRRLGIETVEDLLTTFPRRLEDRSRRVHIAQVQDGESVTVQGTVRAKSRIKVRSKLELIKVAVDDGTGVLFAIWFNQPWVWDEIEQGREYSFFGKVQIRFGERQMENPVWEPAGKDFHTGRWVPIYPTTEGLSQGMLRAIVKRNLARFGPLIDDLIPEEVRRRNKLLPRRDAIAGIHFPEGPEAFEAARRTLAFEELFLLQLGLALRKRKWREEGGKALEPDPEMVRMFYERLPFELTGSQVRALREIERDLRAPYPMMRLLQGDVGSGKTVVAAGACVMAVSAGTQAAVMAPTEILADQHFLVFRELLRGLPIRVERLLGSVRGKERERILRALSRGEVDLLIGTHALFQEGVEFRDLGIAVIDEQHRFGVVQREALQKKGRGTNILVMSATPIPRTVALTLYGEFSISVLSEMPIPKKNVRTVWVSESRRDEVYAEVERLLRAGEKGYVIFPLVEESEEMDLRAATAAYEELSDRFGWAGVGLMHGRLPPEEKRRAMEAFREGRIRLLVSTTVVEVGLDVPDATFLVIEHADRFGLSQLHQLRGRIGRQGQAAVCYAIADPTTEEARRRLSAFRDIDDGFRIAEEDLRIRGPGDLLGTAQHGFVSRLKVADLIRDLGLLESAREEAFRLARRGVPGYLVEEVERRFGEALDRLGV